MIKKYHPKLLIFKRNEINMLPKHSHFYIYLSTIKNSNEEGKVQVSVNSELEVIMLNKINQAQNQKY